MFLLFLIFRMFYINCCLNKIFAIVIVIVNKHFVTIFRIIPFHQSRSAAIIPPPPPQHTANNQEVPIDVL